MSQPIASNQFSHGAGKGPEERPINRAKFRANFDKIQGRGSTHGTPVKKKGARTTYKY
jgi:hypothetical protein